MREYSPPTICHMAHVTCHVSYIICHVSHVMCRVSLVMCHVSCVTCNYYYYIFFFLQIGGASQWRVCYQRGLPRLVKFWIRKKIVSFVTCHKHKCDTLFEQKSPVHAVAVADATYRLNRPRGRFSAKSVTPLLRLS